MTGGHYPLEARLVIDNSFLVMLTEFFCENRAKSLAPADVIPTLQDCICSQIDILKLIALDGCIYCSGRVAAEYQPWNGPRLSSMRHIPFDVKKQLAIQVRSQLKRMAIESIDIEILRHQPDAPRRLIGSGGLSDEDLSLVMVGIDLTESSQAVYVLSNDQDLLKYITWLRRKPEVRELWPSIRLLHGLHSLTYLELVHRSCHIKSETIRELFTFVLREHYFREPLFGTTKGISILDQLLEIQNNLFRSVAIKAQVGGVVA